MNPFLLAPAERLHHWKEFRRALSDHPISEQVVAVADYWSKAPLSISAGGPDDEAWWVMTPWERLYENEWCRNSVAIGMESTLRLSGVTIDRLRLQLLPDDIHEKLLVLFVDDAFVLNYDWGLIRSPPLLAAKPLREWRFDGGHNYRSTDF